MSASYPLKPESHQVTDSHRDYPRPSDSVRLAPKARNPPSVDRNQLIEKGGLRRFAANPPYEHNSIRPSGPADQAALRIAAERRDDEEDQGRAADDKRRERLEHAVERMAHQLDRMGERIGGGDQIDELGAAFAQPRQGIKRRREEEHGKQHEIHRAGEVLKLPDVD